MPKEEIPTENIGINSEDQKDNSTKLKI